MAGNLPYVNQPGSMVKILQKIREAKTPERFTSDFLKTKLGFTGGNHQQIVPLAKKLALLNSDATPTPLYSKFRNEGTSKAAMAEALRRGYKELFDRNEYANNLNSEEFKGLVVEITGHEAKSRVVQLICQTFENLRKLADFESALPAADKIPAAAGIEPAAEAGGTPPHEAAVRLGLSYTINLVLPKTEDVAVFNAIFKSLRENILKK